MQGIWNMSVSGCLCVFLRIFRHVSDVKKMMQAVIAIFPLHVTRLLLNMQHLPLRLEFVMGQCGRWTTWKFPEERFMVEAFQLFLGGGFFGWKFTFVKSTWICEKVGDFLLRIPNHGIHHHGMETTTGWWFHVFFIFTLTLGEDKIQFGSTSISSDWVEVETTN